MPVLLHGPPFGGFDPSTKSKLAERVHDQGAAAKLVEKEQSGMPWFRRFAGFAYFAEISTFATLGPTIASQERGDAKALSPPSGYRTLAQSSQA
jgi:hypothetical protein